MKLISEKFDVPIFAKSCPRCGSHNIVIIDNEKFSFIGCNDCHEKLSIGDREEEAYSDYISRYYDNSMYETCFWFLGKY